MRPSIPVRPLALALTAAVAIAAAACSKTPPPMPEPVQHTEYNYYIIQPTPETKSYQAPPKTYYKSQEKRVYSPPPRTESTFKGGAKALKEEDF